MARSGGSWKKGQSGNPRGRAPVNPMELQWLQRLRIAAKRKVTIGEDGEPEPIRKKGEQVEMLAYAAEVVMRLACQGNSWAVTHIADRLDGRVREQASLEITTNTKARYESYEEVRAALLAEGVDIDRIPMLTEHRHRASQILELDAELEKQQS